MTTQRHPARWQHHNSNATHPTLHYSTAQHSITPLLTSTQHHALLTPCIAFILNTMHYSHHALRYASRNYHKASCQHKTNKDFVSNAVFPADNDNPLPSENKYKDFEPWKCNLLGRQLRKHALNSGDNSRNAIYSVDSSRNTQYTLSTAQDNNANFIK